MAGEMLGVDCNLASRKSEDDAPVIFENPQTYEKGDWSLRLPVATCIAPTGQRSSKGRTISAPLQIPFRSTAERAATNPWMLDAQRKRSAPQAATSRMFLFSGSLPPAKNQVQAAESHKCCERRSTYQPITVYYMGSSREAMTGSETNKANATPDVMKNPRVALSRMPKN
jgi:hypothetical protein